jgi:hypothetical protein
MWAVGALRYRLRQMGARETRSGGHIVAGGVSVVIDEAPAAEPTDFDRVNPAIDAEREALLKTLNPRGASSTEATAGAWQRRGPDSACRPLSSK